MRVWAALLICFALSGSCQAQLAGSYNVVLEENGNALVTLVVTGIGTINVPLPVDVKSPAVRDALYVKAENGVEVSVDAGGRSTIVYKSALLTYREGGSWRYVMQVPEFDSVSVVLYVPENVQVYETNPEAAISHVGSSKSIIWNLPEPSNVSASYEFTEGSGVPSLGKESFTPAILYVLVPLAATAALIYFVRRRGQVVVSPGKQNVLKALTANESKVVDVLLHNGQGMPRSELERVSGIPKSSLASCLYNLESRNIVQVDKSYSSHYVELTQWFKTL